MEDPLPLRWTTRQNILYDLHERRTKKTIALVLCLMLVFSFVVFPHRVLEVNKPGLFTVKITSHGTQAPRGGFLGALAVLPEKTYFASVLLPQLRENTKEMIESRSQAQAHWIIRVWFGSSYL